MPTTDDHLRGTYGPQVVLQGPREIAGGIHLDFLQGILRRGFKDPVLVGCAHETGMEVELAARLGDPASAGRDLVARCINDVVRQGADPLFFLAVVSGGGRAAGIREEVLRGMTEGCREAGCSLLGDPLAAHGPAHDRCRTFGAAVGVAERWRLISIRGPAIGDAILGLEAGGLHWTGHRAALRVLARTGIDPATTPEGLDAPLRDHLLRPARMYVRPLEAVFRKYRAKKVVHAGIQVAEGGIPAGLREVLPRDLDAVVRTNAWKRPPLIEWLQARSGASDREMLRGFHLGIGMLLVVAPYYADAIVEQLRRQRVPAHRIGEIAAGKGRVRVRDS